MASDNISGPLLVTGGSGFLGSQVVRQAAAAGVAVRSLARTARGDGHPDNVRFFRGDILDPRTLAAPMEGCFAVIHAAGLAHVFDRSQARPEAFFAVNNTGVENVIRAAISARVKHVVLVGSVAVYGRSGGREADACRPRGPYAQSKWKGERRALELAAEADLGLTVLRMATVYGEGDPGNIGRLIRALDRGRFIWIGNGGNRKSLIHRDDAARACLAPLFRSGESVREIYNVSGEPRTMREVVSAICSALGRKMPSAGIPASVARAAVGLISGLAGRKGTLGSLRGQVLKFLADDLYDAGKFRRAFQFRESVSLDTGVRREVDWYRKNTPAKKQYD